MWVELRYTRVDANGQSFLILMFTDSTSLMSLRDARDQLRSLGLIDEITGLPGRDLALVQLDQAIALARRDKRSVGLLTVKVDHFRELRETADSEAVDEVIRQFAARITAFVRGSDVPARVSNESFLVVLTALTSSNDAVIVAIRLLLVLAEPYGVVGEAPSLHCSIGVAEFPRDAEDATSLFGAALAAADRAQLKGGWAILRRLRASRAGGVGPSHFARTTVASASSRGRSSGTLWPASSSMRRPSASVWTIRRATSSDRTLERVPRTTRVGQAIPARASQRSTAGMRPLMIRLRAAGSERQTSPPSSSRNANPSRFS